MNTAGNNAGSSGADAAGGEMCTAREQQEKFTDRLHREAAKIWQECLNHPFVRGIGDGSLPIEKFRYFMLQDYVYLFEYAKVFALGVVKASEPALMKEFAENVYAVLHGEMEIHRAYMKRLGIPEEAAEQVKAALPNLSYTSYMLSEAHAGGAPEIVAAILACSWSYAEIGQELNKIPGAVSHPFYGEWIEGYASREYHETNEALIRLMDRLSEGCPEEKKRHLAEIFVNCSRYELDFWNMAWEGAA